MVLVAIKREAELLMIKLEDKGILTIKIQVRIAQRKDNITRQSEFFFFFFSLLVTVLLWKEF